MFTSTFTVNPCNIMHLDLNSCFASIEQQANSRLRHKPIAVAAYDSPRGCIIAPSVEAKKLGIKVGMRVREGKQIYPDLLILTPDPDKYRYINRKILALLRYYTLAVSVRSIDEMVLDFSHSPYLQHGVTNLALEIKQRIKKEIGSYLRVSIGISVNRFLAKLASSLQKPDGLVVISKNNIREVFSKIKLEDIHGIKRQNRIRLNLAGIQTATDFLDASIQQLTGAFASICGYYWYLRLRGFEIDNVEFKRKSYGNSYALYKATARENELSQILCKLVEKMGKRLRKAGYLAGAVHVACLFTDYTFWHHGRKTGHKLYANIDLFRQAAKILFSRPQNKPVRILAVSCYDLEKDFYRQTSLWEDEEKKRRLIRAVDFINERWGNFVLTSARMMNMDDKVVDRIAFGGIKELEEFVFEEQIQSENDQFSSSNFQ